MTAKDPRFEKMKVDRSLLEIRLTLFLERNFEFVKQDSHSMKENLCLVSRAGTSLYGDKDKVISCLVTKFAEDISKASKIVKE